MPENPHPKLLDRQEAIDLVNQHFRPQLDLLTEMTNFSSNLITRAFASSEKKLHDVVMCFSLLKQFATMLDGIDILARQGAVHAAFSPARVAFEVSLYIEWMLVSDLEKKALYYFVGSLREERLWGLRVQSATLEGSGFLKEMGQIGSDILTGRPTLDAEGTKYVSEVDSILGRPEYSSISAEFEQFKKKHKISYEPSWHKVLGVTAKGIAKQLQRLPDYNVYYSVGSRVVHSSSYKDHLKFTRAGAHAHPIRYIADLGTLLNFAFTSAMLVFLRVLGYYRNDELPRFGQRYVDEWRAAFTNIPSVKFVGK